MTDFEKLARQVARQAARSRSNRELRSLQVISGLGVTLEEFEQMGLSVVWASFRQEDGSIGKQVPTFHLEGKGYATRPEVQAIIMRRKVRG